MPPPTPPEEIAQLMRFIAKKATNVTSPMNATELCRQFQRETGSLVSITGLAQRINSYRDRIHEMTAFNTETRVKMLFALNAPIDSGFLVELRKYADVEVDKKGRIIKYKGNYGSSELKVRHGSSSRQRHFEEKELNINMSIACWNKIVEKVNNDELKEDGSEVSNWQRDYEKKRMDLVKFLIERTKIATSPLKIGQLAADFKTEFNRSESQKCTFYRIDNFRQGICRLNQLENSTKVKMIFALSAPVDAMFLKEIQKDAFVELDEMKRIKKYIANDGSLKLEGDHRLSEKANASIGAMGGKYSQSTILSQSSTAIQKGRKRVRQVSEEDGNGEPLEVKNYLAMDFNANSADEIDYDPSKYELDMDHFPIEKKPESLIEVKTEELSSTIVGNHYEDNLFGEDVLNYDEDMEHIPVEKKPENIIEVKTEEPDGPSTSNSEYRFEENTDHILIEPKSEIVE